MIPGNEKIPLLHYSRPPNYGDIPSNSNYILDASSGPLYEWRDLDVWSDENGSLYPRELCSRLWFKTCSKNKKQILHDVYGYAQPGELLAIMGGSGSGKTTLLDTLAYRGRNLVSEIAVRNLDGRCVNRAELKQICAYVQQQDLFLGSLTPREHLIFQALVRLNKDWTYSQKLRRVNEVIIQFSLEKCQNTNIGLPGLKRGLSGGERKRLSLASECLRDPALMICDEPITGLDLPMANGITQMLKELAGKGKTVVASFHQPSKEIFEKFDRILIMTHGEVTFFGTRTDAETFFNSIGFACPQDENPAEIYIDAVAAGKEQAAFVQTAFEEYQSQKMYKETSFRYENMLNSAPVPYSDPANDQATTWNQFRAITWRSWRCALKEPLLIRVRLLQTVIIALLIGSIYFGQELDQDGVVNINGALFIFLTNITFQHIFAVINVFCSELPIFLMERRSGLYKSSIYFLGKTITDLPFCCIGAMIFTTLAYPAIMVNQLNHSAFGTTIAIMVMVANASASFGYFISCISGNIGMALSIGPPLIIPFLLLGGFFLNSGSVPKLVEWMSYLSWFRYGNEALLVTQWTHLGNRTISCPADMDFNSRGICLKTGDAVLKSLGFNQHSILWDLLGLLLLVILFRVMAFGALCWRSRDR